MPTVTSKNLDEFIKSELSKRSSKALKPAEDDDARMERENTAFQSLLDSSKKYKTVDEAITRISGRFNVDPELLRKQWKAYSKKDPSLDASNYAKWKSEGAEGPPPTYARYKR